MSIKTRNIINWILAALVAFIFIGSAISKFTANEAALAAVAKFGLQPATYFFLGIIELAAVALFLFPRTGILGTLLLVAYMGGAISTHVEFAQPLAAPIVIAAFVWTVAVIRFPELLVRFTGGIRDNNIVVKSVAAFMIAMAACSGCTNSKVDQAAAQSLQLLKDELQIRALAEKFSDAANRKDGELFQSLWANDAVWKIGPPINMEFKGKQNMGSSVTHMLAMWDFFVQLSGPAVVRIHGDRASARCYVNEIARKAADKSGNYNLSMYEDELIKENGQWVFLKRTYHTIYQEAPNYQGLIQPLPAIQ